MHYKITIFGACAPYPRLIYWIASSILQGKKDDVIKIWAMVIINYYPKRYSFKIMSLFVTCKSIKFFIIKIATVSALATLNQLHYLHERKCKMNHSPNDFSPRSHGHRCCRNEDEPQHEFEHVTLAATSLALNIYIVGMNICTHLL